MKRNESIDFMRGLVMIIMVLDHVRDFFHVTSLSHPPTDLQTTTLALFFTRWATYLCAPTFVFLSGTSAYLSIKAKKDSSGARGFLLSRGLWLIFLEFTLVNFGMWFDIGFNVLIFEVIAAIGFGFIILGLLCKLQQRVIGIIGLTILAFHGLAPSAAGIELPLYKILMSLFSPGVFPMGNGRVFFIAYPPVPWLGIMLAGFGAGSFFQLTEEKQKLVFLKAGLIAIALFVFLRAFNIYGDPSPWVVQKSPLYSFLSFINVTKYPPSLLFCLLFLGIMFLILSLVQGVKNRWTAFVSVYGKVPLFYFLVHWYIIHPLLFIMVFLQGFKSSDMVFGFNFGRPKTGSGFQLWAVYLIWISVVILMYPLCKWYGNCKQNHREKKWLRYI